VSVINRVAAADHQSAPYVYAEPRPAALIESLRAFGYTPEAAIADLIDNSITAKAGRIALDFFWNGGDSYISLHDDGIGMSSDVITSAMRPGDRSPREGRSPNDLGRFGLGLKTASFSQCRELTVASRTRTGGVNVRRWDLDYVGSVGEWRLLTSPPDALPAVAGLLGRAAGTVVVWTKPDRIVGDAAVDDHRAHDRFLELADRVKRHLAMTFHRYLEGPKRLGLVVNGATVMPWDPFMTKEPATQALPVEPLHFNNQRVSVRPYVLPHRSKLSTNAQQEGAGIKGWNAQQGFYVYRNNRILVDGDWLGLGFQKEEHCKLARIALDITNAADEDWQIDVKKSTARPPTPLVRDLQAIAKFSRDRAQEVYRHRGKVISRSVSADYVFAWQQVVRHGKVRYRINRAHPVVAEALDGPKPERLRLERLLRFVEETVPIPLIGLSIAQAGDEQASPFEGAASNELAIVLRETLQSLLAKGLRVNEAIERLSTVEPFSSYPALIAELSERMESS
jgi:Histidine kinase-, DNA gyrase B-, and HSP90-like ATPase